MEDDVVLLVDDSNVEDVSCDEDATVDEVEAFPDGDETVDMLDVDILDSSVVKDDGTAGDDEDWPSIVGNGVDREKVCVEFMVDVETIVGDEVLVPNDKDTDEIVEMVSVDRFGKSEAADVSFDATVVVAIALVLVEVVSGKLVDDDRVSGKDGVVVSFGVVPSKK